MVPIQSIKFTQDLRVRNCHTQQDPCCAIGLSSPLFPVLQCARGYAKQRGEILLGHSDPRPSLSGVRELDVSHARGFS